MKSRKINIFVAQFVFHFGAESNWDSETLSLCDFTAISAYKSSLRSMRWFPYNSVASIFSRDLTFVDITLASVNTFWIWTTENEATRQGVRFCYVLSFRILLHFKNVHGNAEGRAKNVWSISYFLCLFTIGAPHIFREYFWNGTIFGSIKHSRIERPDS